MILKSTISDRPTLPSFDIITFFDTANHILYFMYFLLFVQECSFKGILAESHTIFVFCYSYGSLFLNDVKLGILILITNMVLKMQNDVIIRKQSKNKPKKNQDSKGVFGSPFERWRNVSFFIHCFVLKINGNSS